MFKESWSLVLIIKFTCDDIGGHRFLSFYHWQVNCHRATNAASINGIGYFGINWKVGLSGCLINLIPLKKVQENLRVHCSLSSCKSRSRWVAKDFLQWIQIGKADMLIKINGDIWRSMRKVNWVEAERENWEKNKHQRYLCVYLYEFLWLTIKKKVQFIALWKPIAS